MESNEPRRRNIWVTPFKAISWAFVVSISVALFFTATLEMRDIMLPSAPGNDVTYQSQVPMVEESEWSLALIISLCAVVFTGLGTVSTAILGWRKERRDAAETRLRIEHLELQLQDARRKQVGNP